MVLSIHSARAHACAHTLSPFRSILLHTQMTLMYRPAHFTPTNHLDHPRGVSVMSVLTATRAPHDNKTNTLHHTQHKTWL